MPEGRPRPATVRTVADLRARVAGWRAGGARVGLVPTMGALHDGHRALVEAARKENDRVITTVFVNPTQFGPTEDFDAYPADLDADLDLLADAGADLLFAPQVTEVYPHGFATEVRVASPMVSVLCGARRPGHFDGVTQVVAKLLNMAQADRAYFGEKDWQQLAVVRQMVRDLNLPVDIRSVPTVRAADGLALSSRNAYLDPAERAVAPQLNATLRAVAKAIRSGTAPAAATASGAQSLRDAGFAHVDYLDCRDEITLEPVDGVPAPRGARLFVAAHLGRARLIDNWPVAD
ncbi:pantoate--beta-alanine ligase [Oceanomicrobium pacificus]|uniref:Pantothenate synthetase n=1 Tax=Oceanomicrobium pacificus TaxID=2692916 RepID=A0A6B0TVW0_9RHOB|nr:pantoate--beta-alanine ligase [Oceanomicrobium pacificus]MXU65294.1 pantoate--beta-alanine ligase [Oceanomicrobium pacificus]